MRRTSLNWLTGIFFIFAPIFPLVSSGFEVIPSKYKIDFEESYGKGHSPIVASLINTPDGGYAFAGTWGSSFAAWLVKTDSNGRQQWEQSLRADRTTSWQRATVVLTTKDDGYLLCGDTNELDLVSADWDDKINPQEKKGRPRAALVAKIDKNGQLVWKKAFGQLGKYYSNVIYQGVAVEGGFVFLGNTPSFVTGQPTPTGQVSIRSLWLFKINESGELLWEKFLSEDDGEYLMPKVSKEKYSKLIIDKDGSIVFATATDEIRSEIKDGKRILALRGLAPGPRKKLLIIKFDKNGNELIRKRLAFGVDPTLMVDGKGYHLLVNEFEKEHIGIRSIILDAKLKVISERVIPSKNFWIRTAVPGPNGGLHLVGYHRIPPNERGEAAVAYLSKGGELNNENLFGINSWPADMVQGASLKEIGVLWFSGMQEDARLTKIKLAD